MRVVQFTDTHIVPKPEQELYGVDPYRALSRALDRSLELNPAPEAFLVTGDLAEDGTLPSYLRFKEIFSRTKLPVFVVPGNHDDHPTMKTAFNDSSIQVGSTALFGDWLVILVSSQVVHKSHGEVTKDEWSRLAEALETAEDRPILVAMHHPPLSACPSSGCQLKNSSKFLDLLASYPNVRVVLSGHLHQEIETDFSQIALLTTPSTFAQGRHPKAGSDVDVEDFWASHSLDSTQQGFRILDLFSGGRFETYVHLYDSAP